MEPSIQVGTAENKEARRNKYEVSEDLILNYCVLSVGQVIAPTTTPTVSP